MQSVLPFRLSFYRIVAPNPAWHASVVIMLSLCWIMCQAQWFYNFFFKFFLAQFPLLNPSVCSHCKFRKVLNRSKEWFFLYFWWFAPNFPIASLFSVFCFMPCSDIWWPIQIISFWQTSVFGCFLWMFFPRASWMISSSQANVIEFSVSWKCLEIFPLVKYDWSEVQFSGVKPI